MKSISERKPPCSATMARRPTQLHPAHKIALGFRDPIAQQGLWPIASAGCSPLLGENCRPSGSCLAIPPWVYHEVREGGAGSASRPGPGRP